MKIPKYARYNYCSQKACEFLEQYNINSFPVNVESIIEKENWGLTPYSELMLVFNYERSKIIQCLCSNDGYTQLDNDNYSIAYNDDNSLGNRKRFTLMHEVAHIYLNHLVDFEHTKLYRGSLTKEENRILENEANAFARNVLVPTSMIFYLKDKRVENIARIFGITNAAAETRLAFLEKDISIFNELGYKKRMYNIFYYFINKRECTICNAMFKELHGKYCSVCGSKTIQWGNGKMKYKEYITDENGRLVQCIKCQNDILVGAYCHICGTPSENYCTNAHQYNNYDGCQNSSPLPSNARYCTDCGAPSLFKENNILIDWSKEKEEVNAEFSIIPEEAFLEPLSDGFMNIPDGIDEELPFN